LFCRMILSEKSATFRDHALGPPRKVKIPASLIGAGVRSGVWQIFPPKTAMLARRGYCPRNGGRRWRPGISCRTRR
jgi:hypothetical protein